MPRNYISNDTTSTRMFRSSFMESLSKVHYSVPLFIYIPVIAVFVYRSVAVLHNPVGWLFIYLLAGIFIRVIFQISKAVD